ncbi:hypothetical protein GGR53DRAFT_464404 [Hypoxylon sp. FL1150]|nr:hypothetical protein GGR53DRAFT_464404 [Hypoxylon sp. FL1150]
MSRKSALGALSASNGAFESATRRIAGSTQRTFSCSTRRNASIAHFTPTSSKQLDDLLSMIRHKIILPSYLPTEQRKKIFSPKYEKKLQSDPIIIEIDGEILKFRYQNLFTDVPQTRRSVVTAVSQFETPADFANLRPLLEGVAGAGRKFPHSYYAKILRVVGAKGYVYEMIECARGVARTGYRLDSSEKANELLHFVQMKAVNSEWDEAQTAKALRWAEMVLELLQEEAHQPRRRKHDPVLEGELPLYRDPIALLAPLHLAAVLVAKHGAEGEAAEKLTKYARDVVRLWPEGRKLTEVQPKELYEEHDKMGYLLEPNKFVTLAAPLLYGLETAAGVAEPELAKELQSRRDILAAEVREARTAVAQKNPEGRGEGVYRQLFENGEPAYGKQVKEEVEDTAEGREE